VEETATGRKGLKRSRSNAAWAARAVLYPPLDGLHTTAPEASMAAPAAISGAGLSLTTFRQAWKARFRQ
jgi:hypothetical protein